MSLRFKSLRIRGFSRVPNLIGMLAVGTAQYRQGYRPTYCRCAAYLYPAKFIGDLGSTVLGGSSLAAGPLWVGQVLRGQLKLRLHTILSGIRLQPARSIPLKDVIFTHKSKGNRSEDRLFHHEAQRHEDTEFF